MEVRDKERLFWTNVNQIYNPDSSRDAFAPVIWSIKAATSRANTTDLISGAVPDYLRPSIISGPPWARLAERGCETLGGARNCSVACTNRHLLFASLNTLGNCVAIAAGGALFGQSNPTIPLTSRERESLARFGVPDLSRFNATQVLGNVAQCAAASCRETGPKRCSDGIQRLETMAVGLESLSLLRAELGNYCALSQVSITSDIAGPGVLIAHLAQTTLVVVLFVLISALNTWARWIPFLSRHFVVGKWQRLGRQQRRLYRSAPNSALLSSGIEFQEAQAYFTLAMQIAAFAAFGPLFAPVAFSSLASTNDALLASKLLRSVTVTVVLPVLLLQSTLHQSRMHWPYTLLLTVAACAVAAIAHSQSRMPPIETLYDALRAAEPVSQCGGAPSLAAYCLHVQPNLQMLGIAALPLALATATLLVADQAVHVLGSRVASELAKSRLRYAASAIHVCEAVVDVGLLAGVFLHLNNLRRLAQDLSDDRGYTYGQYLASMVWLPILGKFMYYNIFSVKDGFEARLSRRFQIVEREDDDMSGTQEEAKEVVVPDANVPGHVRFWNMRANRCL